MKKFRVIETYEHYVCYQVQYKTFWGWKNYGRPFCLLEHAIAYIDSIKKSIEIIYDLKGVVYEA